MGAYQGSMPGCPAETDNPHQMGSSGDPLRMVDPRAAAALPGYFVGYFRNGRRGSLKMPGCTVLKGTI